MKNKYQTKRVGKKVAVGATAVALVVALAGVPFMNTATALAASGGESGKFYTDYETLEDAQAAAAELAVEVAAEGDTLLKNKNNALPLKGSEWVSVFGTGSDELSNFANGYQLTTALSDEGFKVNPQLKNYYAGQSAKYGEEVTEFNRSIENSFEMYGDVAFVVVSRAGGEGMYGDNATVTNEEANDTEENVGGWEHENQLTGKKHFLQFTDSEVALLEYVKAQGFKKIVYIINSSMPMEVYNIEKDEAVDGILWIGRPGQDGIKAAAKILSGEINPSGKTVDTWYTDFTADPTWINATDNKQVNASNEYLMPDGTETSAPGTPFSEGVTEMEAAGMFPGLYGIDYEEDIYVGYAYYETRAYEEAKKGNTDWYEKAVTYPYGYGLSYTSYEYSDMRVMLDNGTAISGSEDLKALFESSEGSPAEVKKATAYITVKNTGNVAGKEAVQLYVSAPYTAGEIEKAHVQLVGFAKTDMLKPGETQEVEITFNIQDMASYDFSDANGNGSKCYELDAGEYTLMAMGSAHEWANANSKVYEETKFSLAADAILALDDFTDNPTSNLFSAENGMYYTVRDDGSASGTVENGQPVTNAKYQFNKTTGDDMTLLSRADFEGTFPEPITDEGITLSQAAVDSMAYWHKFTAENDGKEIEGVVDEQDYPWLSDVTAAADRMKNWTQAETTDDRVGGKTAIQLADMAGINPFGNAVITFNGEKMTESAAWDKFMNQLTWEEIVDLCGNQQRATVESFGMNGLSGADSTWNIGNTYCFTDNCILGATWNVELSEKQGRMIGNLGVLSGINAWWGNGAQVHRSYFGGRAYEYMSEDPIHAGYMASAQTIGAQSKGLACFIKHAALNDQETNRCGMLPISWTTEQNFRQRSLKAFQMCTQEGGAMATMGAFARAGRVPINCNYNILTSLFRKEWGANTMSVTTDAWMGMSACSSLDLILRAGTDQLTAGDISGEWDAANDYVTVNGEKSDTQWYEARKSAMIFLNLHANSAMNRNGIDLSIYTGGTLKATQGATENLSVASDEIETEANSVRYVLEGTLPSGYTMSADGSITGTASGAGSYSFKIRIIADNWISKTVDYTLVVDSVFSLEDGTDNLIATVGEEVDTWIESDTVKDTTQGGTYSAVRYSATGLPEGVTMLEDGTLTGVPTQAGTFNVTVNIAADKQSSGGGWRPGGTQTTNFTYDFTLTVEAGEVIDPGYEENVPYIGENGNWWINGVDQNISAQGPAGPAGADGVDGENGATGAQGEKGEQGPAGESGGEVAAYVAIALAAVALVGCVVVFVVKKRA